VMLFSDVDYIYTINIHIVMLFSDVDYIYTIDIHIVMLFSDVEYNTIFIPYCA